MDIRKIILVFCIVIIVIAGLSIAINGYTLYNSINKRKTLPKPEISISKNEDESVCIKVTCEDGINYVKYIWNNIDDNIINLNGRTFYEKTIKIPYNKHNELNVEVQTINGIITKLVQEINMEVDEEKPSIEFVSTNGSVLNVNASDSSGIDYIEYQWENEQKQRIDADDNSVDIKINIQRGTHKLSIWAADSHGNIEEAYRMVTGVNEPEIEVIKYGDVINITLTHDMGIKKAKILVNDKLYTYDESTPEYDSSKTNVELEYPLKEGENIIKVLAYSMEKLSEEEEKSDNYSYKTYFGKCTYEVSE